MRSLVIALGLAMVLGVTAESTANASTVQACTVNYVESFQSGSTVALIVGCAETGSTWYFAYISGAGSGCPNNTADAVKMEESIAVSMRLSGKGGTLYYNPTGTGGCSAPTILGIAF